jgi:hypothetical protein
VDVPIEYQKAINGLLDDPTDDQKPIDVVDVPTDDQNTIDHVLSGKKVLGII